MVRTKIMKKNSVIKNDIDTTKHIAEFSVSNKTKPVDQGDGVVFFNKPLTITSQTEQWNGTVYDIETMDVSAYKGLLTIDHSESVKDIVGKIVGLKKEEKKVTIDGIDFAVGSSALAMWAKEMLLGGYVTDFSIETIGPLPDENNVYKNSKLIGLSMVIVGNNKLATVGSLTQKIFNDAKKNGLEVNTLENFLGLSIDKSVTLADTANMKYKNIKNTRDFAVPVSYKNAADENATITLLPNDGVDVTEDQAESVQAQIDKAEAPVKKESESEQINKDLMEKMEKLEKTIFDNAAKEPEFKKINVTKTEQEFKGMNYKERAGKQINCAWEMLKGNNMEAGRKLYELNVFHVDELKKAGKIDNSVTIGDFGNFVISPELLRDIEGHRSNFTPLLSRLDYRETLSLQMAYLKRNGDVDMSEVEMCDDGADGNLKSVSDYTADITTKNLHELAAVTPVCNSATRFLAVDLLADVTQGYRTDYDRKRAQLFIARLQQAVNSTGNKVAYNKTSDVTSLKSWIETWIKVQEEIMNGVFIFSQKTYGELLMGAIGAGINGPLAGLFTTGDQPLIAGAPYIIVPNELLPTLNSGETKSFVVEGTSVTIDQAVFYVDLNTFTGRTSGGLMFDLSTEAAYEENGTVKSAFQRNELVLRGSFFRNGAVKDEDKVASMYAAGIS